MDMNEVYRAYFAMESAKDMESYVKCGRRFRTLTDTELLDRWKAARIAFMSDPRSKEGAETERDLLLEIQLRNLDP